MKFITDLFEKVQAKGDYIKKRAELRHLMFQSVSDGVLSDGEIRTIEARCRALGLPPEEITNLRVDLYEAALKNATADRRITEEEEVSLRRIAEYFQVPLDVVEKRQGELARYRLLQEIEMGNLPHAEVAGVELLPGEVVHWVEPASLVEEHVVSREYVAPGGGISLGKGVAFKVGSQRGEFKTKTEMVTVCTGQLCLTNKRLLLAGDGKPLTTDLRNVADCQLHHDTIVVMEQGKPEPAIIQVTDPANMEVVGAIVSNLLNSVREPALQ